MILFKETSNLTILCENLKYLREQSGLYQKDIAEKLSITSSSYGFYEQGKRNPTPEILSDLADIFNVSVEYLLGRNNKSYQQEKNSFILLSKEHQTLISNFDLLNEQGQQFILETMDFALSKPSYKKHNSISQEEIG